MILGIDTSAGSTIAVVDPDGVVRAAAESADPLRHAEVIGTLLADVLDRSRPVAVGSAAGGDLDSVTHVAAGMGPGPFTGLRIGIAAARSFALARGIPVVPVVSHDAVALDILLHAHPTDGEPRPFAVVTDARRREVAYTVYDGLDDDGLPVRVGESALAPRDELDARLAALGAVRRDASVVPGAFLALAAARAIAAGRTIGPAEPLYLRSPDVTLARTPKRVTA